MHGYILELDLKYPHDLHNSHSDYQFAPERLILNNNMLSNYSKDLKKLCIRNSKIEKLVPNLLNKIKYITHYRNLKVYLGQGSKLSKMHKILQFKQSTWLKSYIKFNTVKQKDTKSDFENIFFKLMNNSVFFGKAMENVRKRINCEVVINEKRRSKLISNPCYEYINIFLFSMKR